LVQAGIPLRSSDRNHIHPLVVAGGVACFLNPEPIAAFIDCFLLGEAECLLDPFFNKFLKKTDKQSFLHNLEKLIPGAYVPEYTHKQISPVNVQYIENLEHYTSCSTILTLDTAFKDTFLIETLKGCPHGCRFCSAGFIYRPPRIYPAKNIYKAMDKARKKTNKIGFVSSAIADHPDIMAICDYALKHKFQLSFSSLRADKLDNNFIIALSNSKIKTATLAPEAGSQRMRRIINKNIKQKDILIAVKKLVNAGIINLKLYFMIGLPFEEIEDIHAIVELTKKIKIVFLTESKKNRKIGTITLSVNPFIPKPCTPFQWSAMEDEKTLKKKIGIIRQGLKKIANLKINVESLKKAKIHALLSRGDQNSADIIQSALKNGWASAMRKNLEYCNSIIYKKRDVNDFLPWDFLETRIKKRFLISQFLKAKHEKQSRPCPMIDCNKCRICI
ncbi:MAG: radical SAM protein, partial [Desulfobacula sp.]|nr:radical SAM protein [Desulfobacula sp.]